MCNCLTARDRRQLKANLWRTKTVLRREPGKIRAHFISPIMFLGVLMTLSFTVFNSKIESIIPFSTDEMTIVTNSATPKISAWPDDQTLQSNFSLANCTANRMMSIGLVKPDGEEHSKANQALDRIFAKLNESYSDINNGTNVLKKIDYKSNDALDARVRSKEETLKP